jgi:hypothetical protein
MSRITNFFNLSKNRQLVMAPKPCVPIKKIEERGV